jgi:hypothetical protein
MDLNGQVVSESLTSLSLSEAENAPPVADAGSDQTLTDDVDGLDWVALDGGASVDPDGTPVGYEWYEAGFQVDRGKKTKGVVRYTKAGSVGPNVTRFSEALAPGTYYFRVKAFGPDGAASAHSNVVEVRIKGGGKGQS